MSSSDLGALDVSLAGAGALAPLEIRNAAERLADRLVTAIALGEFVPGQRLPSERDLSTMLAVSRTVVRDALHQVADGGYVEIQRGRNGGAYVRASWGPASAAMIRRTLAPHWRDFEALLDLRLLVEGLIARTAATRRDLDDVTAIRRARQVYVDARDDRDASRRADQGLHAAIVLACRNPYLAHLAQQIRARLSLGFEAEPYSAEIRARAIEQHHELVESIAAGEADLAAELAQRHFSLSEGALRKLLERVEHEAEAEAQG